MFSSLLNFYSSFKLAFFWLEYRYVYIIIYKYIYFFLFLKSVYKSVLKFKIACMYVYISVRWFLGPAMNLYAHKDSLAGQPYIQCSIFSVYLAPRWTCALLQHLCEKSIM